jgi:hypothetical protein
MDATVALVRFATVLGVNLLDVARMTSNVATYSRDDVRGKELAKSINGTYDPETGMVTVRYRDKGVASPWHRK